MNVTDTKAPEVQGDRLAMIFAKQHELGLKYEPIERAQGTGRGLLGDRPWNIHTHHTQEVVKNFAWRVTEELAEAYEALDETDPLHMLEEIADALHFMVELLILQGFSDAGALFSSDNVLSEGDMLDRAFAVGTNIMLALIPQNRTPRIQTMIFKTTYYLGLACNCLKNKPWKQSQIKTDVSKFESLLCKAFFWLIAVAVAAGMDSKMLFDLYFRKSQVNEFRIRSAY